MQTGLVAVAVLVFGIGCGPELTKYHYEAKTTGGKEDNLRLFDARAFALPAPEPSKVLMFSDLSTESQAALITAYGSKAATPGELRQALGQPVELSPKASDHTEFKRRIVLSLVNLSRHRATRIQFAKFDIELIQPPGSAEPPARFVSWDQFASKYETVDLGSVKFTQGAEMGATLGPEDKAQFTGKVHQELEETVQLKRRFASFTGILSDQNATILQEGAVGVDLTGNVTIDVTIALRKSQASDEVPVVSFERVSENGKRSCGRGDTVVSVDYVRHAKSAKTPILAKVTVTADVRLVEKQARRDDTDTTIIESDDVAEYRRVVMALPQPLELVSTADMEFDAFEVQTAEGQSVGLAAAEGSVEAVKFKSFSDAQAFAKWSTECGKTGLLGQDVQLPSGQGFVPSKRSELIVTRKVLNRE